MLRKLWLVCMVAIGASSCEALPSEPEAPEEPEVDLFAPREFPEEAEPIRQSVVRYLSAEDSLSVHSLYGETLLLVESFYSTRGERATDLVVAGYKKAYEDVSEDVISRAERYFGGSTFEVPTGPLPSPPDVVLPTCIYVNGVFNSVDAASVSLKKMVGALIARFVCGRAYTFYNPSSAYIEGAGDKCLKRAVQSFDPKKIIDCILAKDLVQLVVQVARVTNILPPHASVESRALADLVQEEMSTGKCVILVPHSQGNLIVSEALRELGEVDDRVAVVSLGSPVGRSAFGEWSATGFVVGGGGASDPVLALGLNDFPKVETELSREIGREVSRLSLLALAYAAVLVNEVQFKLHSMPGSYMAEGEARDFFVNLMLEHSERMMGEGCERSSDGLIYASGTLGRGGGSFASTYLWAVQTGPSGKDSLVAKFVTVEGEEPYITDVAEAPDGTLWATSSHSLYWSNGQGGTLTLYGNYPPGFSSNALTFDTEGRLFAAGGSRIFEIELAERRIGWVGELGVTSAGDIAISPGGILYAVVNGFNGDYLAVVDRATGKHSLVGERPIVSGNVWGITFLGNTLLALSSDIDGKGSLYVVDQETGVGSLVRKLAFAATGAALTSD